MNVHDLKTESLKRRIHTLLAMHAASPQPGWPEAPSWDWLKYITEALSPSECKGDSNGEYPFTIDGIVIGHASPEFCRAIELLMEDHTLAVDMAAGTIRYTPGDR
jgi:hypothetical protein